MKMHSVKNNKNSQVWGHTLSEFRSHCKAAVCYWRKDGHIDQWNRIEKLEVNMHIYGQLIFDKSSKIIQWGNSNKLCGDKMIFIWGENDSQPLLYAITEIVLRP